MTPDFPSIAALRLGYGFAPHAAAPGDLAAVMASVTEAARPDQWTTQAAADAQMEPEDDPDEADGDVPDGVSSSRTLTDADV